MKFREFTFIPEDKEKPLKVVYEDDSGFIKTNDCTIEYFKRLTPMESESLLNNIFGSTNIGAFDCSGMSDEEIEKIVDKWNSIPKEYLVRVDDLSEV